VSNLESLGRSSATFFFSMRRSIVSKCMNPAFFTQIRTITAKTTALDLFSTAPSLLSLADKLEILASAATLTVSQSQLDALYLSLMRTPLPFSLSTIHYNYLIKHALANTPSESLIDAVMRYIDDMSHLDLTYDGTTYSLLIQAYESKPTEMWELYDQARSVSMPLLPKTYTNLIKAASNDPNSGKSKIWEIYSALKKAHTKPSLELFEELIRAFTKLRDAKAIRKIYTTLTRLSGMREYKAEFANEIWPGSLYAAILTAIAECGAGDQRLINKLMYLLRSQRMDIDLEIINSLIKYWNVNGRSGAALRLIKHFKDGRLLPDYTTYVGLVEACVNINDADMLQVLVLERVYETIDTIGVKTWEVGVRGLIRCLSLKGDVTPSLGVTDVVEMVKHLSMGRAVAPTHPVEKSEIGHGWYEFGNGFMEELAALCGKRMDAAALKEIAVLLGDESYEVFAKEWLEVGGKEEVLLQVLKEARG